MFDGHTALQDTQSLMAVELTSIQEVVDSLCLLAADPSHLPASSQQVIDDYQHTQCKWFCQVSLSVQSVCLDYILDNKLYTVNQKITHAVFL